MGKSNGRTNVQKELQAIVDRKRFAFDPFEQGKPIDIFHDDERMTAGCLASIEQSRDMGMGQFGKCLPLVLKPLDQGIGQGTGTDDLDCHIMLEIAGSALAVKDRSHAALADQAGDPIGTDPVRHLFLDVGGPCGSGTKCQPCRCLRCKQRDRSPA
ncbi:hypothetical protein FHS49_000907 [Sphingobium boeckii]|uniref:Uncharacterized protein n=1 Tax=Sphingobium boeckii TaxID=1082345 RepID=A0A7W9AG98_9SPHN|nr:hypothetical protein [Sphingobium boeckii]MBB5684916.1 hypothetical protein [Sphingobium boeckii]